MRKRCNWQAVFFWKYWTHNIVVGESQYCGHALGMHFRFFVSFVVTNQNNLRLSVFLKTHSKSKQTMPNIVMATQQESIVSHYSLSTRLNKSLRTSPDINFRLFSKNNWWNSHFPRARLGVSLWISVPLLFSLDMCATQVKTKCYKYCSLGSRGSVEVRAIVPQSCGPGSSPGVDTECGLWIHETIVTTKHIKLWNHRHHETYKTTTPWHFHHMR